MIFYADFCLDVGIEALPIPGEGFQWLISLSYNSKELEDGRGSGMGLLHMAEVLALTKAFLKIVALKHCVHSILEKQSPRADLKLLNGLNKMQEKSDLF